MSLDIQLRTFEPGDEESINQGFNETFGLSRSLEEWRWKFGENPTAVVAVQRGEVVAHFGILPAPCRSGKAVLEGGHTVDAYCRKRPELVREGVYLKLVSFAYERYGGQPYDFLYGFPGLRHMRLGLLKLRYADPRGVSLWSRDLSPLKGRKSHTIHHGFPGRRLDSLWKRCAARYPLAVIRNAATIRQRFDERPDVDYRHIWATRWGQIRAWTVIRVQDETATFADLLWDGRSEDAVHAVVSEALDLGRTEKVQRFEGWFDGDERLAKALESSSWCRESHPAGLGLSTVILNPSLSAEDIVPKMYFTMADSDLI